MADVDPATVFVYELNPTYVAEMTDFIAGAAILAGQFVAIAGTGVAWTVHPADGVSTARVVGVALHSAATGAHVAVAGPGSVLKVQNSDTANTMEAGDIVAVAATAAFGCVVAVTDSTAHYQAGVLLGAMAGSGQAYCLLTNNAYINAGA